MALSEEAIKKRLKAINSTQDCIQTTSLWVIHHKESCINKIAKCWMDVYKQANDNLRIALIYVMNDVVQRVGKKDRHDSVKMAFHPHVVNAFAMASKTVKKPITRCVQVFEERSVFASHIIEEMKLALGQKSSDSMPGCDEPELEPPNEIDHATLIRDIEAYFQNAELTEKARNILERSDFNFRDKMADKMKDRIGGTKILNEMDDSRNKLSQFLASIERHQAKCQKMVDLMKTAKVSLNLQLRDVTVVDDAYEKFANGIRDTKKELEESMKSGIFPGMSPPRDAPSPTASDDAFELQGIDGVGSAEDMDIDDGVPSVSTANFIVPVIPISSALDPRLQRIINQKSRAEGSNVGPAAVVDPRQASKAPVVRPQQPPPNFFSPSSAMGTMKIDTSHPPPPLPPISRPSVSPIFNPNTPPPFSNFAPEGPRIAKLNQPNFSMPPPGFLANPPPPSEDIHPILPKFTPMRGTTPFNPRMPPPTTPIGQSRNGGQRMVSPTTPLSGQKRRFSDSNPNNGNEEEGDRANSAQPNRRSFTEKRGNWKKQPDQDSKNQSFDAGRQQSRGFLFD